MLDVLMYLFEYYLKNKIFLKNSLESKRLLNDLREAGFYAKDIDDAVAWLRSMDDLKKNISSLGAPSFRVFSEQECAQLDKSSQGYLLKLEQLGILNAFTREVVLDRVLALGVPVTIEQIKWVTLLVTFNYTSEKSRMPLLLEELVLGSAERTIH